MSMEDDLTWLVRITGGTLEPWCEFIARSGCDSWACARVFDLERNWFTKEKYMARRAELQNKPSWADAPEWAQWLGQIESGNWEWYGGEESPSVHESGDCWLHKAGGKPSGVGGEVLGDWRDTLERRPVDLSEPAGGVKGRGADGAEEINAMAQRLLVALKSDPRSFDTGALAEMVELADAEIVKRDAKVCGGEGYLNNHWFERGELPPVGVECVAVAEGCSAEACKIIAYHTDTVAVQWSNFNDGGLDVLSMPGWAFRPISTERDKAIDEMKLHCPYHGSWDTVGRIYAEALYDAGYRKQNLPAN